MDIQTTSSLPLVGSFARRCAITAVGTTDPEQRVYDLAEKYGWSDEERDVVLALVRELRKRH